MKCRHNGNTFTQMKHRHEIETQTQSGHKNY